MIHYPDRRFAVGGNVERIYLKVVFEKAVNKKGLKKISPNELAIER